MHHAQLPTKKVTQQLLSTVNGVRAFDHKFICPTKITKLTPFPFFNL